MTKEELKPIDTSKYKITDTGQVLKNNVMTEESISEEYTIQKDILNLWEQTICEIRNDIKLQCSPSLVYAKELCDKLEHSMCALAGGHYNLRYSIE